MVLSIRSFSALAVGAAVLLCGMQLGAVVPAAKGPTPLLALSEVKPGMTLTGHSVFALGGSEPFAAEVLALMPDFLAPGETLILARLSGKAMDRYGVVSGMSGSPVFFNGQLVGAVSYRFGTFPKEPIAGITPIGRMLDMVKERRKHTPPWVASPASRAGLGAPMQVEQNMGQAVPIETPLLCGGCPSNVLAHYAPKLKAAGFVPMQAAGRAGSERFPMFAGGPIAGVLVDGDVNMVALGTITWMEGNEVLAFGHPFTGMGDVEIPMATAQVYATIPSLAGSSKIGQSGAVVGALHDDRLHAIAGRMGWKARTVPFHVTISSENDLDAKHQLSFDVVDDIGSGGQLAELAVASAVSSRAGAENTGTLHMSGRILLEGGVEIPLTEMFTAVPARNPVHEAAGLVADVMQVLWRNAFERPRFKDVELTIRHELQPRLGAIIQVEVQPTRVVAGHDVKVITSLRTHRLGLQQVVTVLRVPPSTEPGKYQVYVKDGDGAVALDRDGGLAPYPQNMADLIELLKDRNRNDHLFVYLVDKAAGLRVEGAPMAALPPSMLALLAEGKDGLPTGKISKTVLLRQEVEAGVVVFGDGDHALEVVAPRVP